MYPPNDKLRDHLASVFLLSYNITTPERSDWVQSPVFSQWVCHSSCQSRELTLESIQMLSDRSTLTLVKDQCRLDKPMASLSRDQETKRRPNRNV